MPEGPELHLASKFINEVGRKYIFSGQVEKSEVSTKNPDVSWDAKRYSVSARSRGKEVKVTLTEFLDDSKDTKPETLDILFRFGMSGKFSFTKSEERPKHSHLNFFTEADGMVLSFVDYRRFGRWEVGADWSRDRGPCVLQDYTAFRKHVLDNIGSPVFKKPICEVMLNQKFFNGIGNYLRAEILFRLRIPPFVSAKSVLEKLVLEEGKNADTKIKSEEGDFLWLCNQLPREVVNLDGKGYDPDTGTGDLSDFTQWLRCYYNQDMKNMVDHNGRTIWYCGEAGPLKPSGAKQRGMKSITKKTKAKVKEENPPVSESGESPVKRRKTMRKAMKGSEEAPKVAAQKGHITRGRLAKAVSETTKTSKKAKQQKTPNAARSNGTPRTPKTAKITGDSKLPKTPKQTKASKLKGLKQPMESPQRGLRRSSRRKQQV